MRRILTCLLLLTATPIAAAPQIKVVASGLDSPWSIGHLPDGEGVLVTLKSGSIVWITEGQARAVGGLPKVASKGQGGLMDIMIPQDFAKTRQIYFSYARPQRSGGAGTALGRGVLGKGASSLRSVETLFEMKPGNSGGRHFGSRIVEGRDGLIYMTMGERGDDMGAQDLSRHNGSVVRLTRDGKVPDDNPFVGVAGALPEIYSYGHRNPQGAALDSSGQLWVHEHGAQGGDEINRIIAGANYGWPVISYGRHYSGAKIGEGTAKEGMQQPAFYWDPSIAPSGLAIHSGTNAPEWKGDFFIGSLKFDMISRVDGDTMQELERIKTPETLRVRDVEEGPDGALWFLSEINGALYRMTP
jgi:glucose/arabinose dehydrogenase